jgi:two-component system, NarL family, response regulator LiaR
MAIGVLIVDDHPVARQGLQAFLSNDPDIDVVGEASDGEQAVHLAQVLKPDMVLMDINMPVMDGITAIQLIHRELPAIKILVFSGVVDETIALRAVQSGASGYLPKDADALSVCLAVKAVWSGQLYLPQVLANRLLEELGAGRERTMLTERENEVLHLVAKGWSNKDIAAALQISVPTVKTHVSTILNKLNVSSRTQAALLASNNSNSSSLVVPETGSTLADRNSTPT